MSRTSVQARPTDYPADLAKSDPLVIESVKVPRSVLAVLSVVGLRRDRSRAYIIREALTKYVAEQLLDMEVKAEYDRRGGAGFKTDQVTRARQSGGNGRNGGSSGNGGSNGSGRIKVAVGSKRRKAA